MLEKHSKIYFILLPMYKKHFFRTLRKAELLKYGGVMLKNATSKIITRKINDCSVVMFFVKNNQNQ